MLYEICLGIGTGRRREEAHWLLRHPRGLDLGAGTDTGQAAVGNEGASWGPPPYRVKEGEKTE